MKTYIKTLSKLGACREALEYCEDFDNLDKAWQSCERGDWMLWLVGKLSGKPESESRKRLVLAACQCARLALPYVRKSEKRPLKAIETAESWARGEVGTSLQDVRAAAAATYASAADAAYAADAAAYAADAAAYAADAAYAAYAAAASRAGVLKECAYIVRQFYPTPPEREAL